ncbi:hypothetical protein L7F22_012932 [Adiantum nelumboides]|nr:hypothetical protein [Adiantum nelumboides]
MGYREIFKTLAKKSQNKLQSGSLLPKLSHVKAACRHVNDEVFEKLGSPYHIKATFLGNGGRKVQFNEHNNLFVDLEALQKYVVLFFDINGEECGGVLKFVLKLNECKKILSNKETIQGLEKNITSLQKKDTVLGSWKRKRDLCNIENMKIGSGGLKKQIRALRSLLHPNSNGAGCNAEVHYSRLVPKEVVEELITQKKICKLKGRILTSFMNENQLEPMDVQAILDESGISQMGYMELFKTLVKKSQNKLQRGSLLPKPSHVKAACQHVNDEVFEKLGSPFHIKATFLGNGGRKVQFNEHNNLFVDLEALQRYAVHFFYFNREESDGVLKFVLKLNKCEVLNNKKLERVTITLMNRALDPSITKEDPRYFSVQSKNNILTLGSFQVDKENFEILDWVFSQTQIPSIIQETESFFQWKDLVTI